MLLTVTWAMTGVAPAVAAPPDTGDPGLAPVHVTGIGQRVAPGDTAAAARRFLDENRSRFKVAGSDLTTLEIIRSGAAQTVRFGQTHRGVPVLGAHYLVHLRGDGPTRTVDSTNGRYFTGLTVSTTPAIDATAASRLAQRGLDPQTRSTVKVTDHGLTVLPTGTGILTWHQTLSGVDAWTRTPFIRETYVDAHHGRVALSYDKLNFASAPVSTTGTNEHGGTYPIEAFQRDDGRYELRDRSRDMFPASGGEILTYDAEGRNYFEYIGGFPPETPLSSADTIPFGGAVTSTGAVDAHFGAGEVYDFYKTRLGRDGLDGKGGSMVSVVNVAYYGRPFNNAFWDGQKMVYGGASSSRYSFAADVDVIGHEMTHGVITNSADLVYLNQSGAMNEALADYFGNAIDVGVAGTPMSSPDAGLIGEDLCKTGTPASCALRDLNDGRTTYSDYLGVRAATDNGGVHLNSTIFSGALWDIREKLEPLLADRLIYKALTEYMTPLDGFTDGRNAVLAAARDLDLSINKIAVITAAFDGHGITPGWEHRLGVDSRTLVPDIRDMSARVSAWDGAFTTTQVPETGEGSSWIIAGSTDGGPIRRVSPADGRTHDMPDTDGRRVAWTGYTYTPSGFVIDVYQRSRWGGPITSIETSSSDDLSQPQISGRNAAWIRHDRATFETEVWALGPDGTKANYTPDVGTQGSWLSLNGDHLGFVQIRRDATGWYYNPVVVNLRTGERVEIPVGTPGDTFVKDVVVTERHVFWVEDNGIDGQSAIKRADLDGGDIIDVVTEASGAAMFPVLSGNGRYAVFSSRPDNSLSNASLPKLYQVPAWGGTPVRFSCNRGDQGVFAADEGRRVVWLDGTTGYTNLVTRSRPASSCD